MSLNPNSANPALEALVAAPQPAVVPAANSVPRQAEPERDEQKRGFKRQRESTQAANPGPKVEKIARYGARSITHYCGHSQLQLCHGSLHQACVLTQ